MTELNVYPAPNEEMKSNDYSVKVRNIGGEWLDVDVYEVKVDMHKVRKASMCQFDFSGTVEVQIICHHVSDLHTVDIRPLSSKQTYDQNENVIYVSLDQPSKLSIEINQDRFRNLHLFANAIEETAPRKEDSNVFFLNPGIHRSMDILRLLNDGDSNGNEIDTIYFAPGYHYIEETLLNIPSGKHIYLSGGTVLVGSLICDSVENVKITGRGVIYLSNFERFTAFRGIRIVYSQNIIVEGITVIDPPHYSIFIGEAKHIQISNFKSFSTRGWSDGIDMMSSSNIMVSDIFMRNSDDCIAIYGSRWDFYGDTYNVTVEDAILWADVAHPINIGTHGDHNGKGDTIKNISFRNINVLEHHELQENYWGALSLNAGDRNVVKDVSFEDIFVEDFELGQLIDIRVIFNKDYNPMPGNAIKNVRFKNLIYNGHNAKPSRIYGYDKDRMVEGVTFKNLIVNNKVVKNLKDANIVRNNYAHDIDFV